MRKAVSHHRIAVLSADYRLAPQVGIKDILEDVRDCVSFVRRNLPSRLGSDIIDPTRLAISGSSAGGYLALLAGLHITPKPAVIACMYPITDPLGTFFTTRNAHPRGLACPSQQDMAPYLDPTTPAVANSGSYPDDLRASMAIYMSVHANLAQVLGTPSPEAAKPYRVSRNVYDQGLPPTYILHGQVDSAVGIEQADEVVGAAVGCGVEVRYERVVDMEHFLDTGDGYRNEAFWEFVMARL